MNRDHNFNITIGWQYHYRLALVDRTTVSNVAAELAPPVEAFGVEVLVAQADSFLDRSGYALARSRYVKADAAARSALELDPHHRGAWSALATSYAGLGWFEAASDCLNSLDRDGLSESERLRLGRAVNRWAMTSTRWLPLGIISAFLVGALSVAVAASIPFLARELRLKRLRSCSVGSPEQAMAEMATDAWLTEHRLRLAHSLIVTASVGAFIAAAV